MKVCLYVCLVIVMYVCVYVSIKVCMYVRMCGGNFVCTYV